MNTLAGQLKQIDKKMSNFLGSFVASFDGGVGFGREINMQHTSH